MSNLYAVIDFDGTCVAHDYPRVGVDIGAQAVLRELVEAGWKLILFTMRSNTSTQHEEVIPSVETGINVTITCTSNKQEDAVAWFKANNIPLYGIQTNPTQKRWTDSPKAYGHIIIDDAALGCPLHDGVNGMEGGLDRAYVDWARVREMLVERGILKQQE